METGISCQRILLHNGYTFSSIPAEMINLLPDAIANNYQLHYGTP
jgi:hypothetical protein